MQVFELNLDGLVGPTHHYAGLAVGNLASTSNALSPSNPQEAALQGLAKMRLLMKLGLKQGLLPPHPRPNLALLHQLGFSGSPAQQVEKAYREAPELLSASYSSSFMWTANAATVSPSLDTADKRLHFTAANLLANLHRHQEGDFSKFLLERIFADENYFVHHPLLPKSLITADEGAANHCRIAESHAKPGIHLFVYDKEGLNPTKPGPLKYPARQTLEASQALARAHQLDLNRVVFACQNPAAIDQGVFHNDVSAVANEAVFLVHEEAYLQQAEVLAELQAKANFPLQIIEVASKDISLATAVKSYFFNSQLLSLPNAAGMALIAPTECRDNPVVKDYIDELIADKTNPLAALYYLDLKQSMRNGGGPACLRLSVPVNENELRAMHQGILATESLLDSVEAWVKKHYRNRLEAEDLRDPQLINECFTALDELSQLLKLGSIYSFQRELNN